MGLPRDLLSHAMCADFTAAHHTVCVTYAPIATHPYSPIQMYAIHIWEVTGRYVVGLTPVLRYED